MEIVSKMAHCGYLENAGVAESFPYNMGKMTCSWVVPQCLLIYLSIQLEGSEVAKICVWVPPLLCSTPGYSPTLLPEGQLN